MESCLDVERLLHMSPAFPSVTSQLVANVCGGSCCRRSFNGVSRRVTRLL